MSRRVFSVTIYFLLLSVSAEAKENLFFELHGNGSGWNPRFQLALTPIDKVDLVLRKGPGGPLLQVLVDYPLSVGDFVFLPTIGVGLDDKNDFAFKTVVGEVSVIANFGPFNNLNIISLAYRPEEATASTLYLQERLYWQWSKFQLGVLGDLLCLTKAELPCTVAELGPFLGYAFNKQFLFSAWPGYEVKSEKSFVRFRLQLFF